MKGEWSGMNVKTKPGNSFLICFLFFLFLSLYHPLWTDDEVKLFNLENFSGSLNLLYEMVDEEETTYDVVYRDSNRRYLEAGILLNTAGSIYHPNFLGFKVDFNIARHRSKNTIFSDEAVNNAVNNQYDARLFLFKEKKINAEFYTRSDYSTHDRVFWERYFTTFKNTGFRVNSRLKFLPFELEVYNLRMKSESLSYLERDEKSGNIDLRVPVLTQSRSRLFFTLRNKKYSEAVFNIDYRSLDMMGTFSYRFGKRDTNVVNSIVSYNRIKGSYDLEIFNFRANNLYYFKPHLYLDSNYTFAVDKSFDRRYNRHEFFSTLNHRLFESLLSQVRMGGRVEDSTYQKINALQNEVSFYYNKKIPTGRITLRYMNMNEWSKYTAEEPVAAHTQVFDYSFTDVVILTRPGINTGSLKVTSPDLSYIYVADADYRVDVLQNVITITRLPGGAIPVGGKIRVYYEYLSYPDFRLKVHAYNFAARLNFLKYFHLFYERRSAVNTVRSIYLVPPLESYHRDIYGAQFSYRFINADYTVENYDSNLSAYKSVNFRVSGHLRIFRNLRFNANLAKNRIEFENIHFFSDFRATSFGCDYNAGRNIFLNGIFRDIAYATPQYTRNRESLLVKFRWIFRKIILEIYYEHLLGRTDVYDRGRDFLSVIVRRLF